MSQLRQLFSKLEGMAEPLNLGLITIIYPFSTSLGCILRDLKRAKLV